MRSILNVLITALSKACTQTYVPSFTPMKRARCRAKARFISREDKWFRRRRQTLEIPSCGLRFVLQNNDQIVQVTDCNKFLASGTYTVPTSKQTGLYFVSAARSKQSSGKILFPSVRKGARFFFDRFHFQILMEVRLCPELGGGAELGMASMFLMIPEAKYSRSSIQTC